VSDAAPRWEDLVIVGETLRSHGVKGDILVRGVSAATGDETLLGLNRVFVARGPGAVRELRVSEARRLGERLVLRFEGIDNREEVARLGGHFLLLPPSEAPALPDGACYVYQLIGLVVTTEAGEDLGTIVDVIENPGNDVWVARGPRGEFMIPAVDAIVKLVDVDGRRVVIDPLPGLIPD